MDKRLQTVKKYLELSFTKEKELEDLVFLASEICRTPIASITFVDDEKQYPVVGIGNVVESSSLIAFCTHTIKQLHLLEIPDARNDPRFVNNPLVAGDPYVRFYAGIPLVTTDGFAVGTFCVIGQKPKKLTARQVMGLHILSQHVMHRLEMLMSLKLLKDVVDQVEQNKELIEQAEILKNAFYNNNKDFFILLDTKFQIVSFNTATESFFNNQNRELQKGKKLCDYLLPENMKAVEQSLHKAKQGESTSFELLAAANTDHQSWNKVTVAPTYNSNKELIGIACIGCNIDRDKKQQEKISLQNKILSQIAQLHAHEIRHPLTNILGIIDLLKHNDFKMTKEYLGYLETASKELDEVIRKVVIDSHTVA